MADANGLEFLLNFDGAVFAFEAGYWIKIKARRKPIRHGRTGSTIA